MGTQVGPGDAWVQAESKKIVLRTKLLCERDDRQHNGGL